MAHRLSGAKPSSEIYLQQILGQYTGHSCSFRKPEKCHDWTDKRTDKDIQY